MTDAALRALEERVTAHDRRLTELRQEDMRRLEDYKREMARALELQAIEYERRMEILNGAHEEARRVLGTYVTRLEYDKDMDTLRNIEISVKTIYRTAGLLTVLVGLFGAWKLLT